MIEIVDRATKFIETVVIYHYFFSESPKPPNGIKLPEISLSPLRKEKMYSIITDNCYRIKNCT